MSLSELIALMKWLNKHTIQDVNEEVIMQLLEKCRIKRKMSILPSKLQIHSPSTPSLATNAVNERQCLLVL